MDQYTGDILSIEFGINIVPCADQLITGIKELRKDIEAEFNKEIPLIRIRDIDTLAASQYQILIKGIITTKEDLQDIGDDDKVLKMLSEFRKNIILNLDNL